MLLRVLFASFFFSHQPPTWFGKDLSPNLAVLFSVLEDTWLEIQGLRSPLLPPSRNSSQWGYPGVWLLRYPEGWEGTPGILDIWPGNHSRVFPPTFNCFVSICPAHNFSLLLSLLSLFFLLCLILFGYSLCHVFSLTAHFMYFFFI